MKEATFRISFATPAFLGNAEQVSQWRTPPFKALLRQWWRVAKARECTFDHRLVQEQENVLFGQAKDTGATRSALRIRLSGWNQGTLATWSGDSSVSHPEVKFPVGANLYLGYGPLVYDKATKRAAFKSTGGGPVMAIRPIEEQADLWLGYPDGFEKEIHQALQLIGWFGTMGSRSRNGWGSLILEHPVPLTKAAVLPYSLPWTDCLAREWAHAIGADGKGPLVWETTAQPTWSEVMRRLATIKIAFRTQFKFTVGGPHPHPAERHVLAYPVTKHSLHGWDGNQRLANQIRFKVARRPEGFVGVIVHLPTRAPEDHFKKMEKHKAGFRELEKIVWPKVHANLDGTTGLSRLK